MAFNVDADTQAALQDVVTRIAARQSTYFDSQGRYWQGKLTSVNLPADGALVTPDRTRKVDDCPSWQALNIALPDIPFAVECHVYQNVDGWGWVVLVHALVNGNHWIRTRNMAGTEDWRTDGWRRVDIV